MILSSIMMKTHLFRFLFVGTLSTLINMGVFYLLFELLGIYYILSSVIAFLIGMLFGYFFNRKWTYSSNVEINKEIVNYFLLYLLSLSIGICLLKFQVEFCEINVLIANLVVISFTTMINFM